MLTLRIEIIKKFYIFISIKYNILRSKIIDFIKINLIDDVDIYKFKYLTAPFKSTTKILNITNSIIMIIG